MSNTYITPIIFITLDCKVAGEQREPRLAVFSRCSRNHVKFENNYVRQTTTLSSWLRRYDPFTQQRRILGEIVQWIWSLSCMRLTPGSILSPPSGPPNLLEKIRKCRARSTAGCSLHRAENKYFISEIFYVHCKNNAIKAQFKPVFCHLDVTIGKI